MITNNELWKKFKKNLKGKWQKKTLKFFNFYLKGSIFRQKIKIEMPFYIEIRFRIEFYGIKSTRKIQYVMF